MLLRSVAAALLALTACVTAEDEPAGSLPLHPEAAAADSPALDALADELPPAPPSWTNHRPRPGTDLLATLEDAQLKVPIEQLLANDVDPDGGRLVFVGLGVDVGGTAEVIERFVAFTPEPDVTGSAFYDYVISDGRLQATGRVQVTIAPVNDAPVAYPEHLQVTTGTPVTIEPDAVDIDGDALSIEILVGPAHGALSGGAGGGKLVYASAAGYTGADALVYRASDGTACSAPTTIDLDVAPAP